jgi:hypothetical protein
LFALPAAERAAAALSDAKAASCSGMRIWKRILGKAEYEEVT